MKAPIVLLLGLLSAGPSLPDGPNGPNGPKGPNGPNGPNDRPSAPPATSTAAAWTGRLPDVCPEGDTRCREAKRAQLEAIESWTPNADAAAGEKKEDLPSLGFAFFKMILVLGAVCLLAYLSLGKLLPRLMRVQQPIAGRRIMHVVDRLPIDQRRSIMIIKTGEELYFMVGVTEQGITLLSRLDADDVDNALETATVEPPKLGRLAGALLGRSHEDG